MADTVVLYAAPGMGHMISMVELGKLILKHYSHKFSVTILYTTGSTADIPSIPSYIHRITQSHPSISFRRFPRINAAAADPDRPSALPPSCSISSMPTTPTSAVRSKISPTHFESAPSSSTCSAPPRCRLPRSSASPRSISSLPAPLLSGLSCIFRPSMLE
ncbi:hypothetical protein M0R45_026842 [Rubus argutus]|uniref:Uncharacterized protein n=1 Tax=Rubus argutus TaxID=59490 RepID=A0AAW1X1F4_RUBAR